MLSLLLAALLNAQNSGDAGIESYFNTAMVQNPAVGETPGKGEFLVYHEGVGEPPETGYFMEHEPGEVAEFHLFVPDNLLPKQRYPLLIVYHGGKDGGSGKGTLRGFSKISTKEHPVIVLSPNMYTMESYHELLKAGELPIDQQRVVVFGFSSGGMGVVAAMKEFLQTDGAFTPASMICASTTASLGHVAYPQVPYVVMAGEKETPEFIKNKILMNRRSTCRNYAVGMQQVIAEVRYIEMQGYGHTSGKPEHHAVIRNMIRALPEPQVKLKLSRTPDDLVVLADSARIGDWKSVQAEIARLNQSERWATKTSYTSMRGKILKAMEKTLKAEVKFVQGIGPKSQTWEVLRAFQVYDQIHGLPALFGDDPIAAKLFKALVPLAKSKSWATELEARRQYFEIVAQPPSDELKSKLEALYREFPKTEFGGNRTREKLLALQG
jgi:hypothetical protein